jgi:hypothetical protein
MDVIKKLSMKVEQDHSRQLQDIKNIEDNSTKKFVEGGKGGDSEVPVDFEKLVGSSGGTVNGNTRNGISNGTIEISSDPFDTPSNNPVAEFMTTIGSSNMVRFISKIFSRIFYRLVNNFFNIRIRRKVIEKCRHHPFNLISS